MTPQIRRISLCERRKICIVEKSTPNGYFWRTRKARRTTKYEKNSHPNYGRYKNSRGLVVGQTEEAKNRKRTGRYRWKRNWTCQWSFQRWSCLPKLPASAKIVPKWQPCHTRVAKNSEKIAVQVEGRNFPVKCITSAVVLLEELNQYMMPK